MEACPRDDIYDSVVYTAEDEFKLCLCFRVGVKVDVRILPFNSKMAKQFFPLLNPIEIKLIIAPFIGNGFT